MKKNNFVLLLAAFILSSCTPTALDDQNTIDTSHSNDSGVIDNNNQNTNNEGNDNQNTNDGGSNNQSTVNNLTEYTVTINFCGTDFEQQFKARQQFDNSEFKNNVNSLEEYCDSGLEYENLLMSLTFSGYVQTLDADGGVYLCLGSKKSDGKMIWNSGEKIYKVVANVINYSKYVKFSGETNVDNESHFLIDSTDNSLEIDEGVVPTEKAFEKSYENGVNSFSISSSSGRVLVKKLSITWRG